LRRESSSPDFTRKGNPQRFPFHTFPSLRGGGAARMGGASFLFWSMGTHTPCGGKAAALILRERGTRKGSPFTLFPPCEGAGCRNRRGVLFILEYGNAYPLRRESSSPDFTRKRNPQRFPFHTFPSLRGGGTVGMGGAFAGFALKNTTGTKICSFSIDTAGSFGTIEIGSSLPLLHRGT